jgi:hypothetical protein
MEARMGHIRVGIEAEAEMLTGTAQDAIGTAPVSILAVMAISTEGLDAHAHGLDLPADIIAQGMVDVIAATAIGIIVVPEMMTAVGVVAQRVVKAVMAHHH